MDDPEITELLCGRLLDLIVETETLKALVWSMAAAIPADAMPPDEAAMLAAVLGAGSDR